jgi:predicted nucleic acid-binding protein
MRFVDTNWDAAIIEAARAAGCRQVLSEDLNPGQDYDGVVVINPFASWLLQKQRLFILHSFEPPP